MNNRIGSVVGKSSWELIIYAHRWNQVLLSSWTKSITKRADPVIRLLLIKWYLLSHHRLPMSPYFLFVAAAFVFENSLKTCLLKTRKINCFSKHKSSRNNCFGYLPTWLADPRFLWELRLLVAFAFGISLIKKLKRFFDFRSKKILKNSTNSFGKVVQRGKVTTSHGIKLDPLKCETNDANNRAILVKCILLKDLAF